MDGLCLKIHAFLTKSEQPGYGRHRSAWLFLIAAEAIAAQDGLGYRIFLVRRYLSMDVILPYVAWITLLAFIIDQALLWISRLSFPWYHVDEGKS